MGKNNILLTFVSLRRKTKNIHKALIWCKLDQSVWQFYLPCPASLAMLAFKVGLKKVLLGPVSPWRLQKALEGLSFLRSLARLRYAATLL